MIRHYCLAIIFFLTFLSYKIAAQSSVTRFRGPNGQGRYEQVDTPIQWNEQDVIWDISLPGIGHSSPVAWNDIIFVTSADDEKSTGSLFAVHFDNGNLLWRKDFSFAPFHINNDNSYASSTPAVDSNHVYILWFSQEETRVAALSHDGQYIWERTFNGVHSRHGSGTSPVVVDDLLVFTLEQEQAKDSPFNSVWYTLDTQTGEIRWELERENARSNSQSTPCLYALQGKTCLLFTSEAHGFCAVDPLTGKEMWSFNPFDARTITSPVSSGEILVASCKGKQLVVLPQGDSAIIKYELASRTSPYVPTPVVVDDLLFNVVDNGYVSCHLLETGELLWREKPAGKVYGSPMYANGHLYFMDREGEIVVLQADRIYKLIAVHSLGEGSHATPIVLDNSLILRTFSRLKRVGG